MSESLRRRRFRYDRVMIESARILDPQLSDAVVYLTGAQVELLRNMTQYLRRIETYVVEYHLGYYLTPTVEDYDDLLAIVADLEETLMGNPNTLWGYHDGLVKVASGVLTGDGDKTIYGAAVPAGEVWRVEGINAWNEDSAFTRLLAVAHHSAADVAVVDNPSPGAGERNCWSGVLTLKEGETINAEFYGCTDGDTVHLVFNGYILELPE